MIKLVIETNVDGKTLYYHSVGHLAAMWVENIHDATFFNAEEVGLVISMLSFYKDERNQNAESKAVEVKVNMV